AEGSAPLGEAEGRQLSVGESAASHGLAHSSSVAQTIDVVPIPQAASPPLPPAERFPQRAQASASLFPSRDRISNSDAVRHRTDTLGTSGTSHDLGDKPDQKRRHHERELEHVERFHGALPPPPFPFPSRKRRTPSLNSSVARASTFTFAPNAMPSRNDGPSRS